ncbi:MAG: biotin--[acetyl-CoA-carboxylase] ligase [Thermoplasmata archaeon]|nr:biotin--[acetyl-CoA-carboxylase] ligase [Thermoplasmata archaeon]
MRAEILSLLEREDLTSGEEIADKLGVSRTAVWKHIRSLQKIGYGIDSVRNKGYRLISRPDTPIPEEILPGLGTDVVGKDVRFFPRTTSTNLIAKELLGEDPTEGIVIAADIQTAGRGRLKRRWSSPQGGLWFSIILYPGIPPERGMILTMASSVAVYRAIKETCGVEAVIKWPNDLLVNGKKVCGILTELDAEMDRINSAVIGIGINVNNELDGELLDIATSLKVETGSDVARVQLLRSILKHLDGLYAFVRSGDHDRIREEWFEHSNIIGRRIEVTGLRGTINGTVSDVDESGCLILDTSEGAQRIVAGDIRYLD